MTKSTAVLPKQIVLSSQEEKRCLELKSNNCRDKLLAANIKLVLFYAKKLHFAPIKIEDLIQEGFLGLLQAISRFKSNYENKLATYASIFIKSAMIKHILTVTELKKFSNCAQCQKIMITHGKENVVNLIESKENIVNSTLDSERKNTNIRLLNKALVELDERSKNIIIKRWLQDKRVTRKEIAPQYNISSERIRIIEQQALLAIRNFFNNNGGMDGA